MARLTEAAPDSSPEPTAAEARAAAQAARATLTALLRDQAGLYSQAEADIAAAVDEALGRVLAQLAAQPTDYQLWVLPRLLDGLTRIADDLALKAQQTATRLTADAATLGVHLVDQPLQAGDSAVAAKRQASAPAGTVVAAPPPAGLGTPDAQQLRAVQVMTTSAIKGATARTVQLVNQEITQVVLGVQTPFQAQQAIAALLPDRTANQLRAIVQLGIGQASSTAAFKRLQAQAARDPGIRKMWRRSGKLHARWNHDAIDGTTMPVEEAFTLQDGHKPGKTVQLMHPHDPAGPVGETINCGCTLIAWKANWGMLHKAAKPYTPAELAARGLAGKKAAPKTKPAAPPKPQPERSQATALAAFGAAPGKPAAFRDVTGQTVRVDEALFSAAAGPDGLKAGKQDLAAYWAVQTLRRPTEVVQRERVALDTGEVIVAREFIKQFKAAGRAWTASFVVEKRGSQWVAAQAWQARPTVASAASPAGVRVWPKRR